MGKIPLLSPLSVMDFPVITATTATGLISLGSHNIEVHDGVHRGPTVSDFMLPSDDPKITEDREQQRLEFRARMRQWYIMNWNDFILPPRKTYVGRLYLTPRPPTPSPPQLRVVIPIPQLELVPADLIRCRQQLRVQLQQFIAKNPARAMQVLTRRYSRYPVTLLPSAPAPVEAPPSAALVSRWNSEAYILEIRQRRIDWARLQLQQPSGPRKPTQPLIAPLFTVSTRRDTSAYQFCSRPVTRGHPASYVCQEHARIATLAEIPDAEE
jgi:hypothetical protein